MIAAVVTNATVQAFEAAMLICFGVSWPVAIVKTLRTRRTEGKSFGFLVLIFIGYVAGVTAKCVKAAVEGKPIELVTFLYALNGLLVAIDAVLYIRYSRRPVPSAAGGQANSPGVRGSSGV